MSLWPDVLSLEDVSVSYVGAGSLALSSVTASLTQAAGLVALVGPNGSGKTTLIKAVTGELPLVSGRVLFLGRDVTGAPTHRRRGMSRLFQHAGDGFCGSLTVEENLSMMLMGEAPRVSRRLVSRQRTAHLVACAADASRRAGGDQSLLARLSSVVSRNPTEFSGGELQQLSLFALLIQEPPAHLVLADEPTLNLDPMNRELCLAMLSELAEKTTVLVATHDAGITERSGTLLSLDKGHIVDFSSSKN